MFEVRGSGGGGGGSRHGILIRTPRIRLLANERWDDPACLAGLAFGWMPALPAWFPLFGIVGA